MMDDLGGDDACTNKINNVVAAVGQTRTSLVDAPEYDGTHATADGFQYYLKTHYHEEENVANRKVGSFGYLDPFNIRRSVKLLLMLFFLIHH